MNTELNFEIVPFEWTAGLRGEGEIPVFAAELGDLETGEEFERGGQAVTRNSVPTSRRFAARPRSKPTALGMARPGGLKTRPPLQPPKKKSHPSRSGPWGPGGVQVRDSYSLAGEPIPGDSIAIPGTENIRWAQDCLNHTMELRLAVNGVMGADTRSALRRFQGQQGLRVSGILGPDTEEALKSACRGDGVAAQAQTEFYVTQETEIPTGVESAAITAIRQTIPNVPLPNQTYISLGNLNNVSAYVNSAQRRLGAGIYLITFTDKDGRRKAYSGETNDLGRRLLDHRRCAIMLGVPPSNYQVHVLYLPLPAVTDRQRRDVERLIHTQLRAMPGRVLTNRNLELEEEALGSGWN
jgi:peptidoglycan hydrolase-like protein with peptidoglycan-binding domain